MKLNPHANLEQGNNIRDRTQTWFVLIWLILFTLTGIVLCYYYVDRAFARYIYDHAISSFTVLKWLTYPPPVIQTWSPLLLIIWVFRLVSGKPRQWETILASCCISMILADQFESPFPTSLVATGPKPGSTTTPPSFVMVRMGSTGLPPVIFIAAFLQDMQLAWQRQLSSPA